MSENGTVTHRKAGANSIRTGLFGRGILASRSPWLHQQEGKAQGLCLSYELFDFDARYWNDDDVARQLDVCAEAGFAGVNITHPFKQNIIPHLDALAASAASVGAVNTVRFTNGQKIGHNTDMTGFAESVRRGLADARLHNVVQFGAGGAGSATAHALLSLGVSKLLLVESDHKRGNALAARLAKTYPGATIASIDRAGDDLLRADGVVNATPVGMVAHPGMAFDPVDLAQGIWVADIIYFPLETALLRAARARGCRTLDGRGMAVYQAADAFEIFTGAKADGDRMLASFDAFPPALAT